MPRQNLSILLYDVLYLIINKKEQVKIYNHSTYTQITTVIKKNFCAIYKMVRPTESKVIIDIKETRKLFNELRNGFSREEIKVIRGKLHKKEAVYNILKEKEQKTGLSKKEKNVLERISEYFNKLNNDLSKLKRHRHNIIHDTEYKGEEEIKYLLNNINKEDYYEPIKIKHAFDDNYIEYESRGDKYNNLSLEEYLNIIIPI